MSAFIGGMSVIFGVIWFVLMLIGVIWSWTLFSKICGTLFLLCVIGILIALIFSK